MCPPNLKNKGDIHRCPQCGKPVNFKDNPYRPFCSKRCKLIDLGAWLKEEYKITESMFDSSYENFDNKENS